MSFKGQYVDRPFIFGPQAPFPVESRVVISPPIKYLLTEATHPVNPLYVGVPLIVPVLYEELLNVGFPVIVPVFEEEALKIAFPVIKLVPVVEATPEKVGLPVIVPVFVEDALKVGLPTIVPLLYAFPPKVVVPVKRPLLYEPVPEKVVVPMIFEIWFEGRVTKKGWLPVVTSEPTCVIVAVENFWRVLLL